MSLLPAKTEDTQSKIYQRLMAGTLDILSQLSGDAYCMMSSIILCRVEDKEGELTKGLCTSNTSPVLSRELRI